MNLGIENLSIRKEDFGSYGVNQGRNETLQVAFASSVGQKIFDTRMAIAPADYLLAGFQQPSNGTIANLNLLTQRKRIKLISSLNGELIQYDSFVINSPYSFSLIGGYDIEGADQDETFVLYVDTIDKICIQEVTEITKTYTLPSGQTTLNLGFTYEVNKNPTSQLGDIKVTRLGKLMYRNIGNDILGEGNYYEINAGNGLGTALEFNTAATEDQIISVEFGRKTGDANIEVLSSMERLQSTMIAVAKDVAEGVHGDTDITRYLGLAPNEIERLTFGNLVVDNKNRLDSLVLGSSTIANKLAKFTSDAHYEAIIDRPGEESDIYFNTTTSQVRIHDGTLWRDLGGGGAGSTPQEEQHPVTNTDISNGYIDLNYVIASHSLHFWAVNSTPFTLNYDYTLSEVAGKTRITFLSSISGSITTSDVLIAKYSV